MVGVGRSSDIILYREDLKISDENFRKISKKQFSINYNKSNDLVFIIDHSTNGTFIHRHNRVEQLKKNQEIILMSHDVIAIGGSSLKG